MTTRNEANNTPDAADRSNPLGADLWLHIATDCLHRYAREFTVAIVAQSDGLVIALPGITTADPRLHQGFLTLITSPDDAVCGGFPEKTEPEASNKNQLSLFDTTEFSPEEADKGGPRQGNVEKEINFPRGTAGEGAEISHSLTN